MRWLLYFTYDNYSPPIEVGAPTLPEETTVRDPRPHTDEDAARGLKGNDFLAWSIMCRAAARGCTLFDFGRSKKGTGAYQWKENLGFEARPLYYEYELVRAKAMPDINPLNPKYRLFVEAWKKLPLPLAGLLGPWLSRHLG